MELHLEETWTLSDQIGKGGFGRVYAASSPTHDSAVAKLIPKSPGADRELLFVDLEGIRNVVPIIDSGETEDCWVLIMPRAEKSLRQHLDDLNGPLLVPDTIAILTDIATALVDLDGTVVHRDLKPANVLLLNSAWCLADFGISRYAEATTAPDTQKFALSFPYAAPERWRGERATNATDVYALGVIAYEMLSGSLPFSGPAMHDFRDQHLHGDATQLSDLPASFVALVDECMYKAPEARPSPANVVARLSRIEETQPSTGLAKLQEANRAEVDRRSEAERQASEARTEAERRDALAHSAISGLSNITETLKTTIMGAAPAATLLPNQNGGWSLQLNQAELTFVAAAITSDDPWGHMEKLVFDVVAHASLRLRIPVDQYGYEGRSHSLWYCDATDKSRYKWFETAFMVSPLVAARGRLNPFAMDPGEEAARALWVGMAEFQVAWPFTPLIVGELDEFVDRWAGWFAEAANGNLQSPSSMPERASEGTWRRD